MAILEIDRKEYDESISDIETLRKSKIAYDYIDDIIKYSNIRMDKDTVNELINSMDILKTLYEVTYSYIRDTNEEELQTNIDCKNCDEKVLISDNLEYSYLCEKCEENFYAVELGYDKSWTEYDDIKCIKTNPNTIDVIIKYNSDSNILHIGNEYSSGEVYRCFNANEILDIIHDYCKDSLILQEEKEVENEI